MRVLIVEDEQYLAEALQTGLAQDAIAADIALDGERALELVSINEYDAVVLDRDVPGVHGDVVCQRIVTDYPGVRVLMLTAAGRLRDKVHGFALGADDYLAKPFALEELVARLRALARRPAAATPPTLRAGDLELDPFRMSVTRASLPIRLTNKQFAVLELLLRAEGGIVSQETLLEKVWDEHADPFTSAPRVTVSTLRKALGEPALIETVTGRGYRIAPDSRG